MKSFNEWRFEQTIEEIIQSNINMAIDQADEYTDPNWLEGDAYAQNVYDACLEQGYTKDQAFSAKLDFKSLAKKRNVRFAGD